MEEGGIKGKEVSPLLESFLLGPVSVGSTAVSWKSFSLLKSGTFSTVTSTSSVRLQR